MIQIAICSQDQEEQARLAQLLFGWFQSAGVLLRLASFATADAFLQEYQPGDFGFIFLDANLAPTSGLELARHIRKCADSCQIVFLSQDGAAALSCYQVHPAGFFVKPVAAEALSELLQWNRGLFLHAMDSITVVSARIHRKVLLADILYVSVSGRTSRIHLHQEQVLTNRTLNQLAEQLPPERFFRCHRSYVVNGAHVRKLTGRTLELDNGEQVPVSEDKLHSAREWVAAHCAHS